MQPEDVRRSRRLSLVLRHRPWSVGIELDRQGWTDVDRLLQALAEHGMDMTRDDLRRVVASNDKRRFELDGAGNRIRARQGHTVEVDLGLSPATPPAVLFHGTARRSVASILATGLDPRGRHQVHLSEDVATARRVGGRRGPHAVLTIDAGAMAAAGHTFWRSTNGVWLTDHVPASYITEDG